MTAVGLWDKVTLVSPETARGGVILPQAPFMFSKQNLHANRKLGGIVAGCFIIRTILLAKLTVPALAGLCVQSGFVPSA